MAINGHGYPFAPPVVQTRSMPDSMSELHAKNEAMAKLLEDDAESWASLQGLFAILALPPLNHGDGTFRRRVLEIEVAPDSDKWVAIEGASIDMKQLIVWSGSNGSRTQYVYRRGEPMPRWRTPSNAARGSR